MTLAERVRALQDPEVNRRIAREQDRKRTKDNYEVLQRAGKGDAAAMMAQDFLRRTGERL